MTTAKYSVRQTVWLTFVWFQDVVIPQIEINSSLSMASLSLTSPYSGKGSTLLEDRICQSTPTTECAASTSETPMEESSDLMKFLQRVSPSWLQQSELQLLEGHS